MKRNKIRTVICIGCNKEITDRLRPGQKYCSRQCFKNSSRPERKTGKYVNCHWCNKKIYVSKIRLKEKHHFCCQNHFFSWYGRNKTIHKCKICGKEFKWSPSRQKNNNITYCSMNCRDKDPERRNLLISMNAKLNREKSTKLEIIGYSILDSIGTFYIKQHIMFGKFCVDAFVPSAKLVIQFDGDYWHGNKSLFPSPDKRQSKRISLDISQDKYLKKCGMKILRIWESDIKKSKEKITEKIKNTITENQAIVTTNILPLSD